MAQDIAIVILRPKRKVIKHEIVLKKKKGKRNPGSIYKTGPEVEFAFGFLVRGLVHLLKRVGRPLTRGFKVSHTKQTGQADTHLTLTFLLDPCALLSDTPGP